MRLPSWLYYRVQPDWARFWSKHLARALLVHINKTGGSSVEKALGMPFQHRTATEFIDLVGRERWNRCFTFAFVRNPWAKVLSHYRFRRKTNQTDLRANPISFGEWVGRAYGDRDPAYYDQPKMFMPQVRWICDTDGVELVNFVGRFERLEDDFRDVCDRLGRTAKLPHLKSSGSLADYRTAYDEDSAAIVSEAFAEDLRRFDYTF